MSEYSEAVKQRILDGDLSKPNDLYPLLIKELAIEKDSVAKFIGNYFDRADKEDCRSVVDIGGGKGDMLKYINVPNKTVVDKRDFDIEDRNIKLVNEEYRDYHSDADIAIYSEFLHLFSFDDIRDIILNCQAKYIVIVENVFDDFLDLRLRLWTGGRCINPSDITMQLDIPHYEVSKYNIWIKRLR